MSEEIDRWVQFMKEHPNDWKKIHTQFINAQFEKADAFIQRLAKLPDGKKRIMDAYGITNAKGYPRLLK